MASSNPSPNANPTPSAPPAPNPNANSLYPTIDMADLAADDSPDHSPPAEEVLLVVPGAILHLIDPHHSVELASGDLSILRLRLGPTNLALLARVADVQWPITRDEAAVRLDAAHYFFTLRAPSDDAASSGTFTEALNYGLTFRSGKEQERLLAQLDSILATYTNFSAQKVVSREASEVLDATAAGADADADADAEKRSAAYWTTLAPNVEEYGGSVARAIAAGSGQLVRGILWCGDVTVDRLRWGNEFLKKRMGPGAATAAEVSPETLRRIKRVKRITQMSEKVATGILSGVVKVTGYFTSSIVNSKAGKKFFGLLPGEIVLASLDGFGKICDAVEVAGKNVLSTSSTVTTGLVSHKYGEKAAEATNEGFDAAGHAIGTAWAVFKIRKAFNPKNSLKPTALAKSAAKAAAADLKSKQSK